MKKKRHGFKLCIKDSLNKSKFTIKVSKRGSSNPWLNSYSSRNYRVRNEKQREARDTGGDGPGADLQPRLYSIHAPGYI